MTIAYFGTGLLGAGFVRHQLERGTAVHVWNRSPEKARALVADGATFFDDPAKAVAGVDQLHLTLADDASVDAVLEPLAGAIDPSTWIVDHTTTAPTPTAERVRRWDARGRRFVHAPVFMGPSNTREGTGFMLVAGERARYDALLPTLETMTGKVLYLGEDPGRAAAFKLFGNLMIITIVAGLGDVNRLAHATGVSTADALSFFSTFNPGAALAGRADKIASGDTSATFELTMARKDVRLMLDEAARGDIDLAIVPAVAALFDATLASAKPNADVTAAAALPATVHAPA
jgi:3-hydroxyisobutyrate dehydrogenase